MVASPAYGGTNSAREHVEEIVAALPLEDTREVLDRARAIADAVDRSPALSERPARVVAAGAVYMALYRLEGSVPFLPRGEVAAAADCSESAVESAWRIIGHSWGELGVSES